MTDPQPAPAPSQPRSSSWRTVVIAAALLTGWVAFLYLLGPQRGDGLEPPRLEELRPSSRPVETVWPLHDLNGAPVDFASFRGRPVLVNLWATWCPPCVAEMPSIARLAADPRMKGVAVVCVSVDDSREAPRRFVEGKGWTMTMLHADEGVPGAFHSDGIPATFLLDPEGRVVASEVGAAKWDDPSVVAFFDRWTQKAPR